MKRKTNMDNRRNLLVRNARIMRVVRKKFNTLDHFMEKPNEDDANEKKERENKESTSE